ncbi:MAG: efflux RND transporter periplasmic adaptor subunit [Phycisphaeraceae bacterium]
MTQSQGESHTAHQAEAAVRRDTPAPATSVSAVLERVLAFDGSPDAFLTELIAGQCELSGAAAGAILQRDAEGRTHVLAAHPAIDRDATPPSWLARAAELADTAIAAPAVHPLHRADALYGQPADEHLVLLPIRGQQSARGLAAFHLRTRHEHVIERCQRELELSLSLLALYEMRLTLQQRQMSLRSLGGAIEVLTATNEQPRFKAAAMALCNEIATRWRGERVSLGLLRGRYVKLVAMSQTEHLNRKMKVVQDLESAMEECLDQDTEIVHPAPNEATYIHRATADFAAAHGPAALCSLPLRHQGEVVGVLTIERPTDQPIGVNEIELLRLTCDLCTPRLMERFEQDRWIGARLATQTRRGFAALIGPRHTWAKVTAVALLATVLFLVFAQGTYRVSSPFVIEATTQRVVPAPFEGYLEAVHVEPGDAVEAGVTALATLETTQLRLELARAIAERATYLKEADVARQEGSTVEVQIARARADRAQAEIDWLEHRIAQATLTAPITGVIVKGDLQQQTGAPVQTGQPLFHIAPLEELRAVLHVPDQRIGDIAIGQRGRLATATAPGRYLSYEIITIDPVAEVIDQQNAFRVRARLLDAPDQLRPGMKGVAKTHAGEASYAWIWTHEALDWLRMKLWI